MADRAVVSACPAELRELLAPLAEERVKFSPCPDKLQVGFEAARRVLGVGESAAIEELLAGQCRTITSEGKEDAFEFLLHGFEPPWPQRGGRLEMADMPPWSEEDLALRRSLQVGLLQVRQLNGPLEQWVRSNGEFAIPEEPLELLERIVTRKNCRMSDEEVDSSYRAIRSLEELAKIENESEPQRAKLERLLVGVHKIIDQKIKEFFR